MRVKFEFSYQLYMQCVKGLCYLASLSCFGRVPPPAAVPADVDASVRQLLAVDLRRQLVGKTDGHIRQHHGQAGRRERQDCACAAVQTPSKG